MTGRYLETVFILLICMALAGCASANKIYITEIDKGKSIPGETAGYIYNFSKKANSDVYLLSKRKYCFEKVEKIAHERTRIQDARGAAATVLAPIVIAFPRTTWPLVMRGFEKGSGETIEKIGTVNTGQIMPCGEYEPATHEALLMVTSEMGIFRKIQTNSNGIVNLSKIISSAGRALYVNVFVKHGDFVYFVATIYIK